MKQSHTGGKEFLYRLLAVIALTFILVISSEFTLTPGETLAIGIFLAIPFFGLFFIRHLPLWSKIVVALLAGLLTGIIANKAGAGDLIAVITPIGTIFIRLISMLIVPLVFSTLLVGTASMGDVQKLGRIGRKTLSLYLLTTAIAIILGLSLGIVFHPGSGVELEQEIARDARDMPRFIDTMLESIPVNPVKSLAEGKILQVIVFAIFSGVCISLTGFRAKAIVDVFDAVADVMFTMTQVVMRYAPYGVFAMIAVVAGQYGEDILRPLIKVVALVYLGSIFHALVVYGTLVKVWGHLAPTRFFKSLFQAMVVAFTTSSSSATLPVTMRCVQEHLGVSKDVAGFVLPLGSTINMDGTALYLGVCTLFVSQFYGISMGAGEYLTVIITAILVSIGAAGIPGAAAIMLALVLQQIGLPAEGIALIIGIDRILDMIRTCTNVTGDACVSVIVAETENELFPPSKTLI